MNEGIEHIIKKEYKLTLINVSKKSVKEVVDMINDIGISNDPKIIKRVLYYNSNDITIDAKNIYNMAFTIPIDQELLVFFYKGDYLHFPLPRARVWNTKDGVILRKFLDRASFDFKILCDVCDNDFEHLISCSQCGSKVCKNCVISWSSHSISKKDKCPYCKLEYAR